MCESNWYEIDYSKVPSCAMHRLKKAFKRHDEDRFNEWISKVEKKEMKINAKQLYPHQCVESYLLKHREEEDPVIEEQWKVLVENTRKLGIFSNSLVVCDVSSSMKTNNMTKTRPLDVAVSLGLLIAETTQGVYNGTLITFSEKPEFIKLDTTKCLLSKVKRVNSMEWGYNTNLMSVFKLILSTAKENRIAHSDMPERLYIISDMQFDSACKSNTKTNFQVIRKTYEKYGYSLPQIVFWNVNGSFSDYPITVADDGSILISGFSQSIMKYVSQTDNFSPMGILDTVLESYRYLQIREQLI